MDLQGFCISETTYVSVFRDAQANPRRECAYMVDMSYRLIAASTCRVRAVTAICYIVFVWPCQRVTVSPKQGAAYARVPPSLIQRRQHHYCVSITQRQPTTPLVHVVASRSSLITSNPAAHRDSPAISVFVVSNRDLTLNYIVDIGALEVFLLIPGAAFRRGMKALLGDRTREQGMSDYL